MRTSLINRAFLGCIVALATPVNAADRTPIIDMHLHSYTVREPYQQNLLLDFVSPSSSSALQVLTLAALEQHNIVLAVTDGHELQEYRQEAPGRILPGCGISGRDSVSALRERLQSGECSLLTESRPQRRGIAIDAPRMEPYFSLAEDLDVPVGVHMGILPHEAVWRPTIPERDLTLNNPASLQQVLERHPDLRVYVTHSGWPMLEEMLALMEEHSQVYVDVAGINWSLPREVFHQHLRELVEAGFVDRIMFGSCQMLWPDAIELSIEAIESAPFLTKEQKRKIFYGNAARFLRLEQELIEGHHRR